MQVIESQPHLTILPQPATVLVPVPACCVWALPELPHPLHHAGNRVLCLASSSAQVTVQKVSLMSAPGECRVLPQLSFGPAEAPGCFLEVSSPQPMAGLGSVRHEQIFLPLLLPSPRNTTGSGTPPPRSHPPSCSDLTFAIVCWMFFLPPPPAIRSPKPLAAERGGGTGEGLCPWAFLHTSSWRGPHVGMEFFAPASSPSRSRGRAGRVRAVCAGSICQLPWHPGRGRCQLASLPGRLLAQRVGSGQGWGGCAQAADPACLCFLPLPPAASHDPCSPPAAPHSLPACACCQSRPISCSSGSPHRRGT